MPDLERRSISTAIRRNKRRTADLRACCHCGPATFCDRSQPPTALPTESSRICLTPAGRLVRQMLAPRHEPRSRGLVGGGEDGAGQGRTGVRGGQGGRGSSCCRGDVIIHYPWSAIADQVVRPTAQSGVLTGSAHRQDIARSDGADRWRSTLVPWPPLLAATARRRSHHVRLDEHPWAQEMVGRCPLPTRIVFVVTDVLGTPIKITNEFPRSPVSCPSRPPQTSH
jgi:hypothetical protein